MGDETCARVDVDRGVIADSMGFPIRRVADGASFDWSGAVRGQNIWHSSWRKLAECGRRLGVDVRRRACGVASADARWSFA